MRFYNFINENKHTDYLETAACLGVVASSSLLKKIDKFFDSGDGYDDISDEINSLLDKNLDWVPVGKDLVKESINDPGKFAEVCGLIKGMGNFISDIVSREISNPVFIHNKINDYYKIEQEVFGEIKSKANTADCIVTNTSPDNLFKSMRNSKYSIDESKGMIEFDNGTKMFQVSLKKAKKEAQLGKVTQQLRNMGFDVSPTSGLYESKILNWFKNVSNKVWNKFSKLIQNITKPILKRTMKKFSSGISKRYLSDIFNIVNEGKMNISTKELVDTIMKNPNDLLIRINSLIDSLLSKQNEFIHMNVKKLNRVNNPRNPETAFKLAANYKTLKVLNELVGDVESINTSIKSLISDMLFGATKLPLWKVYGDFGSGVSYEYLGTIERFISESVPTGVESMGVKISPQKGGFYTVTISMIEKIDEEGKHYIMFRTGTNSSSRFTFIVEGTQEKTINHNEKLSKLL